MRQHLEAESYDLNTAHKKWLYVFASGLCARNAVTWLSMSGGRVAGGAATSSLRSSLSGFGDLQPTT